MPDSNKKKGTDVNVNEIDVDPATLLFVVGALLLLPLLFVGFFAH